MSEPLQGPWQPDKCPDCGGGGNVWFCQNCGATQGPGTSWAGPQGAQAFGQNPPCNSCGSTNTQPITCTRCDGSGETDEDLYPGAEQNPAWLQESGLNPFTQGSAATGEDPDTDPSLPAVDPDTDPGLPTV